MTEVAELEKRVTQASRARMGKLRSVEGLRSSLSGWNCVALPRDDCVTIVTDAKSPKQCARELIDALPQRGIRD